jgi:Flp pilus assembly protein TadG
VAPSPHGGSPVALATVRACVPARHRSRHLGQSLVEFALVAPLFFLALFVVVDGGLLLYSMNAVDQSATVGTTVIAAAGRDSLADIYAVQKMAGAGLGSTSLITVTEIQVMQLADNPAGGFQTNSDGSPKVQTGCSGGPNGGQCVDRYSFTGGGSTPTVTVVNGTCASSVDQSQCPPWPPAARNVASGTASYVALKILYTYHFFTGASPQFSLSSLKTFRLEPQT